MSTDEPDLTPAELARFRSYGTAVEVEVGEVLVAAGDPAYDLILLDDAAVEIVTADEQVRAVDGEGRFVGELSLLTGQRAPLTIRATRGGTVHRVDHARFRALMDRDPELSDLVLRALVARRAVLRHGPAAKTVEIVGSRMSAPALALRRYAARLKLAHEWVEADSPGGEALLRALDLAADQLPAVVLPHTVLTRATPGELADALGLVYHQPAGAVLDLVVVGSGPAGLAAAVYGASEGLATLAVDAVAEGGQAASSSRIENYLGFVSGISGADLTGRAAVQALKFGAALSSPCTVTGLRTDGGHLVLALADGDEIATRSVLVATGARYRALPLDRWEHFEGAGIFYAATALEARACGTSPVAVVGGANSAGQAALYLAGGGATVTLVVRGDDLGHDMSSYLADRVVADPRITVRLGTQVTGLDGDESLAAVELTGPDGTTSQPCSGLFCFIGAVPASDWLTGVLLDEDGFVRTDVQLADEELDGVWAALGRRPLPYETSVPGVFAAGDVRAGSMKRVAAAVGEGSSAIRSVHVVVGS